MKEIVESQKNAMGVLKGQINDLKETIVNLNKVIVGLVSEVSTIKSTLSMEGLNKNLTNLLDIKLLIDFNVDRKQDKKRLLDFPKFVNAIYQSLKVDGLSKTKFLNNLRIPFRLNKNRYYKKKCLKRKAGTGKTFLNSEENSDSENIDHSFKNKRKIDNTFLTEEDSDSENVDPGIAE
ncbi:uncharacterized protein LOC124421334 isoform X1 [Lucilia cuprina]|uniref:uncharacterized protein LOC124421334 isoform X1 n=1 Tax=Lucilia cuprina TaxID=7375 RepID=UPI001F059448|nr:uncharacterized protein LOC124421334 isoform X1 [Lucilia cuprina]